MRSMCFERIENIDDKVTCSSKRYSLLYCNFLSVSSTARAAMFPHRLFVNLLYSRYYIYVIIKLYINVVHVIFSLFCVCIATIFTAKETLPQTMSTRLRERMKMTWVALAGTHIYVLRNRLLQVSNIAAQSKIYNHVITVLLEIKMP